MKDRKAMSAYTELRCSISSHELPPGATPRADEAACNERSRQRNRRIVQGAVGAVLSRGIGVLTALISVPLTLKYLGPERYGLWATMSSVIAMLGFADLGLGSSLVNAISSAEGREDRQAVRHAVSSGFFMLLAIAAVVLAAGAVVNPYVPWARVFNVESDLASRESSAAMLVLVLCFALNMPLGVAQRVQLGFQEVGVSNLWTSLGSLLGLGCVGLVIFFQGGLPLLVLAMSGAPVLVAVINSLTQFCWLRPWLRPRIAEFEWATGCGLAKSGLHFFLLQILTIIGNSTDSVIVAQLYGVSAVGSYTVTRQLFSIAMLGQFFVMPLWPAFGEALARGDVAWARRTLQRTLLLSLGVALACSAPLLLLYGPIIRAWAAPEMVPSLSLAIGFALWTLLGSYGGAMSAFLSNGELLGRQVRFFAVASVVALALKVVLGFYGGVAGVLWATLIGYGVFYLVPAARLAYSRLRVEKFDGGADLSGWHRQPASRAPHGVPVALEAR